MNRVNLKNKISNNSIQKDLVSIITPCYNSEKYITQAIESVINQKYQNINWDLCINNIEKTQNYINRNGYLPLHMTCLFTSFQKILKKEPYNSFDLNDWVQL